VFHDQGHTPQDAIRVWEILKKPDRPQPGEHLQVAGDTGGMKE